MITIETWPKTRNNNGDNLFKCLCLTQPINDFEVFKKHRVRGYLITLLLSMLRTILVSLGKWCTGFEDVILPPQIFWKYYIGTVLILLLWKVSNFSNNIVDRKIPVPVNRCMPLTIMYVTTITYTDTQRNIFEILSNQTEIRLWLLFSRWFGTKRTSIWF